MHVSMLKVKLHRATVTEANLNYTGSITIDSALLEKSGLMVWEKVHVVNINNGSRFETYVIEGEANSGTICINGAAARLVQPDDEVIIMAYVSMPVEQAKKHKPVVFIMDKQNGIAEEI